MSAKDTAAQQEVEIVQPGPGPVNCGAGGLSYFGYRLAVTAKLFDRKFVQLLEQHSQLTLPQWRCIAQLGLSEPGTVRSLAEGAVVDRAEVSRSLRQLVAYGLVDRHDNSRDQRSPQFTLTQDGKRVFDHVRKPASRFIQQLMDGMDDCDVAAADRVLWAVSRGCLE